MITEDCDRSASGKSSRFALIRIITSSKLSRFAFCLAAPIALLTTGSLIGTAASKVDSNGTFENGLEAYPKLKTCCQHSLNTVNSPVRAGSKAARFELRKSDGTERSELRSIEAAPRNSEVWYGFSNYLPKDWTADKKSIDIIAQWGSRPDYDLGEESRIPPLALVVVDKNLTLSRVWDADQVTQNNGRNEDQREGFDLGPYQTGVWTDWVFHVKWSYESDGLLEVWKNGKLVVRRKGPNIYNDQGGPFFNIGIYKPRGFPSIEKRIIYYDEVRIGNADSSYQAVSPGKSNPKPPNPEDPKPPTPRKSIRIEAEGMALSGYRKERSSGDSGGALISLLGASSRTGTATARFPGASGNYRVMLGYIDEPDGESRLEVSKQNSVFSAFSLNQSSGSAGNRTVRDRTVAGRMRFERGDKIQIEGTADPQEWARVDYIRFVPVK